MSIALKSILLDHAPGIMLLVERSSLAIREVSASTLQLLGYRREELVGCPISDIECSLAGVFFWDEVRQGGSAEARGVDTSYLCASGDILPAARTVSRVAGGDGDWLVIQAEPLDARRRTEEDLAHAISRLRATLEATADGILLVSRAGAIVNMNRRFARLWELPEELLLEHDDGRLFDFMAARCGDPDAYRARLAAIAPDGDEESFDILQLADGRTFERKSMPARHANYVLGRVYSFTDISQRKRLEQAHLRSQKLESLGTLSAGIAHDFNNILAAIRGNADLAAKDVGPDHIAAVSLEEVKKASGRATELVRRIMAFGRSRDARQSVVDLGAVVSEVLTLLRSTVSSGISLDRDFAADTPRVLADAGQIHEAIVNLTTNAVYDIGQQAGSIEYRLEPVQLDEKMARGVPGLKPGRYARLTVKDSGRGMDAGTMERIFDAFYTTKPVGEGTGLGLSMVHGIMKGHGGAVTVESSPGMGSSFALYFPAAQEQVKEEQAAAARPGLIAGQRVLYVDDEEALVFLARRVLTRLGHRFFGFSEPREALAAFRAAPQDYDILVTDLSMPLMSGFDLAREVLALRPGLPVLMTSGHLVEEDERRAREAGIRKFIPKPVTMEELGQEIDATVRGGELGGKPAA